MNATTQKWLVVDDNGMIPLWHGSSRARAEQVAKEIETDFDREVVVREPKNRDEWDRAVATVGECE